MIVICSPRLQESLWCSEEIRTFIALKGYDHVLPVLIEGEPKDSFPDELIYREEYIQDENGNQVLCTVPVEPLAADVRANSRRGMKKKIDSEIVRLLAPMFHFLI